MLKESYIWAMNNSNALILAITIIVIFVFAFISVYKASRSPLRDSVPLRSLRPWDTIVLEDYNGKFKAIVVSVELVKEDLSKRTLYFYRSDELNDNNSTRKLYTNTLPQDTRIKLLYF